MRQKLKKAASGMLSVAMVTSALLADFTPSAYAEDGVFADVPAGAGGSVTSNYIAANLDADSAQNAAASNEENFKDLLLSQIGAASVMSLCSEEEISASGNNAKETTTNDNGTSIDPDELKDLVDEMISGMDQITPAGEYDENGLAPTYHYIMLNYTLVEDYAVWDGMTINDIWQSVPEAFVASYLTTLNVYTQEGNEDYYVAFADPASINGLGSAVYADFTDGSTEAPTVYNDRITFDAETGLIYIPKSFYYNANGEEILRQLEAQVLVPYSFEDDTVNISVTAASEIEGVTALTGTTQAAALDVTVTVPVVDSADADQISIEDLYVTVNNDPLAFDLTNGGGFYDQETGELTIAAAGNTVYAVDVQIREDAKEDAQSACAEHEVLTASADDTLSLLTLAKDTHFYGDIYYATDVSGMKTLEGVVIHAENVKRGQTFTYAGAYEYKENYSSSNTDNVSKVITATAPFAYYYISGGSNTAVDGENCGGVNADGTVSATILDIGSTVLCNTADPDATFNRIAALPDNMTLTASDGSGTISWTSNITSNPSGYENFVALHCVASATASTGVISGTGDLTIRILYRKAATASEAGYTVFSIVSPTSYTQAGCAVYKVEEVQPPSAERYYARFGVNKVSSADSSAKLSAYFAYRVTTRDPAYNHSGTYSLESLYQRETYAASIAEAYENGIVSTTAVKGSLGSYFDGSFVTSTSGVGQVALNSDTCSALTNCGGDPIYVTLAEVIPAEGYVRRTGVWVLKITPGTESYTKSTLDSVTYYSYNSTAGSLNAGTSVSKTDYYFTVTNTPESYYARVGFDKYEYSSDNTAGNRLDGAVVGIADSEADAKNGALKGGTSYASTIVTTSSGSAAYYQMSLGQGVTYKTVYAYEASAPSGYARNRGYWKSVLQGTTDTSGSGTKVVSATYYDYSGSTGAWGSYTLGTSAHYDCDRGWYTQGSDTVMPVVHLTDKRYYYSKIGLCKTDSVDGSFVAGAAYVLTTSQDTAKAGADGTGSSGIATVTTGTSTVYFDTQEMGGDTSKTYYIYEKTAPANYERNTGYWAVTVTGTAENMTGDGTQITKLIYYASSEDTTGTPLTASSSKTGIKGYISDGTTDAVAAPDQPIQLYGAFGLYKKDDAGDAVSGILFDVYTGYTDGTLSGKLSSGITTDSTGYGYLSVSSLADAKCASGAWYQKDGTTKTFYVRENQASAETKNLEWNSTIYKVVIMGAKTSADCTVTVTNAATGAAVSTQVRKSNGAAYAYFTHVNQRTRLYGQFSIQKVNEDGDAVWAEGITWNAYTDAACTMPATTASISSNSHGIAVYPEITWAINAAGTNKTQTFYIKEDASTVPAGMYVNTNVYKVVVTGSTESADKCSIAVTYGATGDTATTAFAAGDIDSTNLRFNFMNARKSYQAAFKIYKTDEQGQPIEGIQFGVCTDEECTTPVSGNHVLTTGADGDAVYTLEPWHSYTGEDQKTLYVKELGEAAGNGWYVIDPSVYRFEITASTSDAGEAAVKVTNLSTGEDVTVNDKSSAGCNLIVTNELVRLYGMIAIEKMDENQKPVEALFEVYTDEALTEMLGTIATDAQSGIGELRLSDYYDWTRTEYGDVLTFYLVEKSNDCCHVKYPYTIKAEVHGKVYEDRGVLTDPAAIRQLEEQCTVAYAALPLSEADEALAVKNGYSNEVSYADSLTGAYGVKVINYSTKVSISKKDFTDCEEISGAQLTVYKKNPDGTKGESVETWITDGTPHLIEKLKPGTYILEETQTPDHYQRAENVIFTVSGTGEIQTVEMFDKRTYGKVEVEKVDENGDPVGGVVFTITNKQTGEIADTITTDENGYACSEELPIDDRGEDGELYAITYVLTETYAPAGVVLNAEPEEFVFYYTDDETPVVTVSCTKVNMLQKGRIAVMKKGMAVIGTEKEETEYGTIDKLVFGYVYLPGVEFTIYADEALTEAVMTVTTDTDGYAFSEYLPVGTYYVVETYTPAGYARDDMVYTVTIDGIVQSGEGIEYVLDVTKNIENHLCSSTLNIYKVGADKNMKHIPLESVLFGVYADEDIKNVTGTVVIKEGACIAVIRTDADGIATMTENLPAGKYYYKELETPDDFVLDDTEYTFEVTLENDNAVIEVNKTNPLVNRAKSGTLTIHKVDQDGNPLGAGVEFVLTCSETGERWVLVTDENGIVSISDLPIRYIENGEWVYYTYTLRETRTLDNYKLDESVYTFSFTADSTDAEALYQSFTVRNVILGVEDYSIAGGIGMLLASLAMVIMAMRRRKEGYEEEKTKQGRMDLISVGCDADSRRNIHDILS